MSEEKRRAIVVTGFGPFGAHPVNASWEAVKLLKKNSGEKLKKLYNVDLIIEEMSVVYDHVSTRVPQIWREYNPLCVIHVGVSGNASCLTIESKAFSSGYTRKDVTECCPDENTVPCNALTVGLDVNKICKDVSDKYNCIACVSDNAGRYLCEFALYQSLTVQQNRTLFIHVPDFNVYSAEVTEHGLFSIICCVIESIDSE